MILNNLNKQDKIFSYDFFEEWIENDLNPFMIFDKNGKLIFTNIQAQLLLSYVESNILFELALSYSSQQFGYKKTFIDLEYGHFRFNALNTGYKSEDFIGLQLYKNLESDFHIYDNEQFAHNQEVVNIYTVIDLCISANSINKDIDFQKEFDPSFPEIKIDSRSLIKILHKVYSMFSLSSKIKTELALKIGEHIEIKNKKYRIFTIKISGDDFAQQKIDSLFMTPEIEQFMITIDEKTKFKKIIINAPFEHVNYC